MTSKRAFPALLILASAAALASCAPVQPSQAAPSASAAATPTEVASPSPSGTPEPAASAPAPERPTADNINCDSMLRPDVLASIKGEGLISAPKIDYLFGIEVAGAHLACPWGNDGDMHSTYSYSWTTLTPFERDRLLMAAGKNGYIAEAGDLGTWLTRDDYNGLPEGGFLVGHDYVVVTSSRESVTDIVWVD